MRHEGSELEEQAAIVRPQKLFSQKSTVACMGGARAVHVRCMCGACTRSCAR